MIGAPRTLAIAAWAYFFLSSGLLLSLRPSAAAPIPEAGCTDVATSRAEAFLAHPLAPVLGSASLQAETKRLLGEDPGPTCSESLALGLAATTGLESLRQHAIWVVFVLALALVGTHLASVGITRPAALVLVASITLLAATRRTSSVALVIPFVLLTVAAGRAWRTRSQ